MNQALPLEHGNCQSCTYFKSQDGSAGGTCHRFPPQFAGEGTPNESHRWKFPWVGYNAWCGEYRSAQATA